LFQIKVTRVSLVSSGLFESILTNKLPQFRHKWIIKWSRVEQSNEPTLCFLDFLEYLKTAIRIAKNVERCDATSKDSKSVEEKTSSSAQGRIGGGSAFPSRSFGGGSAFPSKSFGGGSAFPSRGGRGGSAFPSYRSNTEDTAAENQGSTPSLLRPSYADDNIEVSSESYCVICEKAHALTGCSAFLALSPAERSTLCRNKGLCFKCTHSGHTARACKSSVRCIKCGGPHHALLHSTALNDAASGFVPNQTTFAVKAATPTAPVESA